MQWLVGAGEYLDEVETNIALMQTELNNQIQAKMLYFILIAIGIVGFFSLFFKWLNHRLKRDLNLFVLFFKGLVILTKKSTEKTLNFLNLTSWQNMQTRCSQTER